MCFKSFYKINASIEVPLIFVAVCALIFSFIPLSLQIPFLSGGNSFKLTWYFLAILSGLWMYDYFRGNNFLSSEEYTFIKYISFLIVVLLISNIIGLLQFPYYNELFNAKTPQIEKLPNVLSFINKHGIDIKKEQLMVIWITIRAIKGVFLDIAYSFGFSFILYDIFKNRYNYFFNLFIKAVIVSVIMLSLYSGLEISYLFGGVRAQEILTIINPYIHPIAIANGWWPPLLWGGQLRSVFSEPSHMGNYLAFAIPFLWAHVFISKKINVSVIVLLEFYTVMIFLTKARTAVSIYFGLLILLIFLCAYVRKSNNVNNANNIKKLSVILAITLTAFFSSVAIINNFQSSDKSTAVMYMRDNVASLASMSKRSNGARYALIKSNIKTGKSHPFFGVGNLLGSAYTIHNLDSYSHQNEEVKLWLYYYQNKGPLKYGIDAMNEYVTRFTNNGIIGLLTYMFPFVYIIIALFKMLKKVDYQKQLRIMFILMAIIGTAVAGCNGSLNAFYTYWMVLPLGYAIKFGDNKY